MAQGSKQLSIAQQAFELRRWYPGSTLRARPAGLTWEHSITPYPLCGTYEVKVDYDLGYVPLAFVVSPKLFRHDGLDLPHCYNQEKQSLCLVYQTAREWTSDMFIAQTTVPWISEWLIHYEIWCVTETWEGGGVHLGPAPWERQPA